MADSCGFQECLEIRKLAHAVHRVTIGSGAAARSLDGNQVGLIVGGLLILVGAVASSGIARPAGRRSA